MNYGSERRPERAGSLTKRFRTFRYPRPPAQLWSNSALESSSTLCEMPDYPMWKEKQESLSCSERFHSFNVLSANNLSRRDRCSGRLPRKRDGRLLLQDENNDGSSNRNHFSMNGEKSSQVSSLGSARCSGSSRLSSRPRGKTGRQHLLTNDCVTRLTAEAGRDPLRDFIIDHHPNNADVAA